MDGRLTLILRLGMNQFDDLTSHQVLIIWSQEGSNCLIYQRAVDRPTTSQLHCYHECALSESSSPTSSSPSPSQLSSSPSSSSSESTFLSLLLSCALSSVRTCTNFHHSITTIPWPRSVATAATRRPNRKIRDSTTRFHCHPTGDVWNVYGNQRVKQSTNEINIGKLDISGL